MLCFCTVDDNVDHYKMMKTNCVIFVFSTYLPEVVLQSNLLYTTLTNFSRQYLVMCKVYIDIGGVQWLSGRVLDSRLRGRRFEPHRRH